jgi:hypothetical protein
MNVATLQTPHANGNSGAGAADQRPVVVIPPRRPDRTYARRGNLILPLRFARRMAGWNDR